MHVMWTISVLSPLHKMHVGKLRIGLTMHVAQNPCEEWWFKPAKCFRLPKSTALIAASTQHFCTNIPIQNQPTWVSSTSLTFLTRYFENPVLWIGSEHITDDNMVRIKFNYDYEIVFYKKIEMSGHFVIHF